MNLFKSSFTSLLIFRSRKAGHFSANNSAEHINLFKGGPNSDMEVQVSDTTGVEEN